MNPQQLPKTSKFYSRCKKCDIEKTLGGGYHLPLGSPKVKRDSGIETSVCRLYRVLWNLMGVYLVGMTLE